MRAFEINNTAIVPTLVTGDIENMTHLDAIDKMEIGGMIFTRMGNPFDADWEDETHEVNCVILRKNRTQSGDSVTVYNPVLNLIGIGSCVQRYKNAEGEYGFGLYSTCAVYPELSHARNYVSDDELAIIAKHKIA